MPMRNQPDGVHRVPRGDARPPDSYHISVDGDYAGWMERLDRGAWRAYRAGLWPKAFKAPGAYLAGVEWLAGLHRAAAATSELVKAAEDAQVQELSPAVADPFRGDQFADPLA